MKFKINTKTVFVHDACIYSVFVCVLQDELRPEYEEALQVKKAKMKAQAKKKVFVFFLHFCAFK